MPEHEHDPRFPDPTKTEERRNPGGDDAPVWEPEPEHDPAPGDESDDAPEEER